MVLRFFLKEGSNEYLLNEEIFIKLDSIVKNGTKEQIKEFIEENKEQIFKEDSLRTLKILLEKEKVSINLLWAIFYLKFLEDKSINEKTKSELINIMGISLDNETVLSLLKKYKEGYEKQSNLLEEYKKKLNIKDKDIKDKEETINYLKSRIAFLEEFKNRYLKIQEAFLEVGYNSSDVLQDIVNIIKSYDVLVRFLQDAGIIKKEGRYYKIVSIFPEYVNKTKKSVKLSKEKEDILIINFSEEKVIKKGKQKLANVASYKFADFNETREKKEKEDKSLEFDVFGDALIMIEELKDIKRKLELEMESTKKYLNDLERENIDLKRELEEKDVKILEKDKEIEMLKKELERYKKIAESTISSAINTYKENN